MSCLHCQKDFEQHTKEEAIGCAKWIQERNAELASSYHELWMECEK